MKPIINIKRTEKGKNTTLGHLYYNKEKFCYTLEDTVRRGEKIPGVTAIPEGVYKCKVTYSDRFKRKMILLYNEPDFSIKSGMMRFTGVRIHGGNRHTDTEGCPLVAYSIANVPDKNNDDYVIYGTAEHDLTELVLRDGKGECIIIIENCFDTIDGIINDILI